MFKVAEAVLTASRVLLPQTSAVNMNKPELASAYLHVKSFWRGITDEQLDELLTADLRSLRAKSDSILGDPGYLLLP